MTYLLASESSLGDSSFIFIRNLFLKHKEYFLSNMYNLPAHNLYI